MGYLNIYKKTKHQFLFWKYTKDTCVEKDIIYDFHFEYYGDNGLLHVAKDVVKRFEARNLIYKTHRMMEN